MLRGWSGRAAFRKVAPLHKSQQNTAARVITAAFSASPASVDRFEHPTRQTGYPHRQGRVSPPSEDSVKKHGSQLLAAARASPSSRSFGDGAQEALINWALTDPELRVQLLRFIDCSPKLSASAFSDNLLQYLTLPGVKLPQILKSGVALATTTPGILRKVIMTNAQAMSSRFIAGQNAATVAPVIADLRRKNIAFTIDLLGEACVQRQEALDYYDRYLEMIEALPEIVGKFQGNPMLDTDYLGPIPRTNLSIKLSAMHENLKMENAPKLAVEMKARLTPLLQEASRKNVHVNFDVEAHSLKDFTLGLLKSCAEEVDFSAGYSLQTYLRTAEQDTQDMIDWCKAHGRKVQARLVKGAYWDHEVIRAEEMGWPIPVWTEKYQTDAAYETVLFQLLSQIPTRADEGGLTVAVASHNARSIGYALAACEQLELPQNAIEVQVLRGMAKSLRDGIRDSGIRVREYLPIGEKIPGMAYLMRRMLENTSGVSWVLAASKATAANEEELLLAPAAAPRRSLPPSSIFIERNAEFHELGPSFPPDLGDGRPFFSEPTRDFSSKSQRAIFQQAISARKFAFELSFALTAHATPSEVQTSIKKAAHASGLWASFPVQERASIIARAASRMRAMRDDYAALIVHEIGKTWSEADGEVCEAIDFCEYYAREAVELQRPRRLGHFLGEWNTLSHHPRGPTAVIGPWNFPFAILAGMSVAALVTGNSVIMKPAEQTPLTAMALHNVFLESGVPKECVKLLLGEGESVGAALANSPEISTIAFTGSKDVGLGLIQTSGHVLPGQRNVKRVIAEMGGKNCIIVDESADIDEAVIGVRNSAFSFAGQKCSAASRIIVHDQVYDEFIGRLIGATRALRMGDATDPGVDIGPVIDHDSKSKIFGHIRRAEEEGARLLYSGDPLPEKSASSSLAFVAPHLFYLEEPTRVPSLWREEIFGPVLAIARVQNFAQAIKLACDSDYRLTGGIYSRTPNHIEFAKIHLPVGNLYINRGVTGARVARQPFGGAGMSGVGSKAGGGSYLQQFVEPRVWTENMSRRGFAPGL